MREGVRIFMGLFQNKSPVINGFPQPIDLAASQARGDYRPEAMRANMLFGTPDEVLATLRQYEAGGVDVFHYNASFSLPHAGEVRALKDFACGVIAEYV